MHAETVTCQVCGGTAERVTWRSHTACQDYRCTDCPAGGAITKQGRRTGPVFDGTTEIAAEILQRRAHA